MLIFRNTEGIHGQRKVGNALSSRTRSDEGVRTGWRTPRVARSKLAKLQKKRMRMNHMQENFHIFMMLN